MILPGESNLLREAGIFGAKLGRKIPRKAKDASVEELFVKS
jgi:hypothetical protein